MAARSKILLTSLVAIVVVLALAGAGVWWFFRDDAPAAVSLESAVATVDDDGGAATTDTTEAGTTATTETADGIDGAWSVDTTSGDFDFESATGTFAGFRISEELSTVGSTEAVGRTGDVTGSITIDGTTLTEATFEVDLTTITTNESRHDDKVQQALDTGDFPTATFVLTEPVDLGATAADGESVSVVATGDLTIHGVTKSVQVPIQAQLVDDTIVAVGSVDLTFSEFGVEVPKAPIVLSVDDHGTLELQLLLTRSPR